MACNCCDDDCCSTCPNRLTLGRLLMIAAAAIVFGSGCFNLGRHWDDQATSLSVTEQVDRSR